MQFFNLHTHQFTDNKDILELVNQYPREFVASIPFYSIGIHPWYIEEEQLEVDFAIIESKLEQKNCLAIGECGLDKRIKIPMDLQQLVFKKQLLLAQHYQKPVVIHCVAAFQEVIAIKKELNISVPMLIHGFSKNSQVAKLLLDNGFYLSFGKYLLRNPELEPDSYRELFKSIPNDRFFLETDTAEVGIQEVYALAAKHKNIEVEELQQLIEKNYNTVFNKLKITE